MIDLSNIIQSTAISQDQQSVDEESRIITNLPDDTLSDDSDVDTEPFILLFADLLSHVVPSDVIKTSMEESEKASAADDGQHSVNSELSSAPPDIQQSDVTSNLESLVNNVAMNWIESEHFEAPQQISVVEQAKKAALTETLPKISETNVKVEQAVSVVTEDTQTELVAVDSLKSDYNPKSESSEPESLTKFKDDLYESLKILTAVTPATSETGDHFSSNTGSPMPADGVLLNPGSNNINPTLDNINLQIPAENLGKQSGFTPQTQILQIPVDINSNQWADKFSEQIVWLGNQNIKSALIKIHPEDLGPIEISVKVVKDTASVSINTHNSHVRDIVDQTLPKLRDMMAEQGLSLSDVHIGTNQQGRQFSEQGKDSGNGAESIQGMEDEIQITSLVKRPPKGLIDYFA